MMIGWGWKLGLQKDMHLNGSGFEGDRFDGKQVRVKTGQGAFLGREGRSVDM